MENVTRSRIKFLVPFSPGIHLRELQRTLGMSFNSTRYHIDKLTKTGEILRVDDSGYSRLYPKGTEKKEILLFTALRNTTDRRIITLLGTTEKASGREICEVTGLAKSTISEHVTRLLKIGIVQATELNDKNVAYSLTDPIAAQAVMKKTEMSIVQKATERFTDLWDF